MKKPGLSFKITVFTSILIVITAGLLIYFSYTYALSDLEKSIGERLEAIATTGALMIDGDLHNQIKNAGDQESEAFKKIQSVLREIKNKNKLKADLYTLGREGEDLKYTVMTHNKPFIGDLYEIREEMWPSLNDGKSTHTGIYKDEHGSWLTAYAPIFDSGGNISGILDVDIHLDTFLENLQTKILRLAIISGIILLFGITLSLLLSRRLVKKLTYLSKITEKISLGQMERTIKIKSGDEVGELAESLERMRISLKMAMDIIEEKDKED